MPIRALLIAAALAGSSLPAAAQVLAVDPDDQELTDYDAEAESHSEFWEQALSPGAGTYPDLVDKAVDTIRLSLDDARTILEDAIARQPELPQAHFWLGYVEREAKRWGPCAKSLGRAVELDPGFSPRKAPPRESWSEWKTDYALGLCLALSGDLDKAADRLGRITSRYEPCGRTRRRAGPCYGWEVGWRLGEVLMALGRLEEAIAALELALQGNPNRLELRYTLAVALERDEQDYRATELLERAYRNDHMARSLRLADRHYIPASDGYYYRALAAKVAKDFGRSLVLFRAYLEAAPRSPWAARARDHIAEVIKQPGAVEIRGRATFDTKAMHRAINAALPALERCLAPLPNQVVAVAIRRRLTTSSRGRRPGQSTQSVHVNWLNPLGVPLPADKSQAASACIRAEIDKLGLPPLFGYAGEQTSYEIELFSRQTR